MKRRCTKAWGRNGKVLSNGSEESDNSDSSDEKRMLLGYGIDMMEESHKLMYRKSQSTGQDSGIFCSQENTIADQEIVPLPLEEARERSSCSRSVDSSTDDDSDESAPDVGSFEEASVTPEVAQQIFADCCALYKARKISADNAFKLKLVECLSEILKLEQFVGNLMLATHAVEIGGMIYRCRVDCTYRSTCRLVEFVSRFVEKEHDNVSAEQEQFQVEKPQVLAAGKNRQRLSKGRFVTDDDGKLNVQFEYKSSDAASRRVSLQTNLTRYINEDMDFNYSSYFKSMHYQEAAEQRALVSDVTTELSYDGIATITWLPFNHVIDYDSDILDIWGQPRYCEDGSSLESFLQMLPSYDDADCTFKYMPERHNIPKDIMEVEDDISLAVPAHNYESDAERSTSGENETLPRSVHDIQTLDDLRKLFESFQPGDLVISNKYDWEGPKTYNFRPPNYCKARKRKKTDFDISYEHINLEDTGYIIAKYPSSLELSDNTITKWIKEAANLLIPSASNYEELEDYPAFAINDYSKKFTTFFNDPDRFIDPYIPESPHNENFRENLKDLDRFDGPSNNMGCEFLRVDNSHENEISDEAEADHTAFSYSSDYFRNSDSLLYLFPEGLLERLDFNEADLTEETSGTEEFERFAKFIKKPKPIDMNCLKGIIRHILKKELFLNDDCQPTQNNQTSMEFLQIVLMVSVESKTSNLLANITIPLIFIGLLHVIAENKLFLVPAEGPVSSFNPLIVCRGKKWRHQENIPGTFEM